MEQKIYHGQVQIKDEAKGEVEAVFATLNAVDHDGDVTIPGAFTDGEKVRLTPWNHNYGALPVGRGEIHEVDGKAIFKGRFFLDTQGGREHYLTVKELAELQEWSYEFDVLDAEPGQFNGQNVRFLKRMKVHGVAPVGIAAGVGTQTTAMKCDKAEDEAAPEGKAPDQGKPSGEAARVAVGALLDAIEFGVDSMREWIQSEVEGHDGH